MRSRTSRGVPEWSGGKDLYMESCCSGSGKSSGFFCIVPGSFQKVPEDSGGVWRSRKCSTTSNTAAWAVRGRPSLNGPGAPAPQGPCAWEGKNPKGGGLHLTWEALLPLLPPPKPHLGLAAPLEGETLDGGAALPLPYIYWGFWGCPRHENVSLSAQPYPSPSSSSPAVLGEALRDCHAPPSPPRRRAAAGWSLPQPLPLSLLDQGVGDVTGLHVC